MSGRGLALSVSLASQAAVLADLIGTTSALPALTMQHPGGVITFTSWACLAYITGWASALLLARRLARLARWPLLLACGQLLFAAAAAATMLTGSWPLLLAARAVQGIGCAVMTTFGLGVLLRHAPRHGGALLAASSGALAGSLLAHTLAAALAPTLGWRLLLAPGLILAACSMPLALALLGHPAPSGAEEVRLPRPLALAIYRQLQQLADGLDAAADSTEQAITTLTGPAPAPASGRDRARQPHRRQPYAGDSGVALRSLNGRTPGAALPPKETIMSSDGHEQ
ncbi:MFS transporter [Nonomuraea sp. NPDC050536]|uniref:MFS transporter n=1 Tax=Nonomuraea sp. NPDC050536 TaxID=3364366 RepID=UPI0037C58F37